MYFSGQLDRPSADRACALPTVGAAKPCRLVKPFSTDLQRTGREPFPPWVRPNRATLVVACSTDLQRTGREPFPPWVQPNRTTRCRGRSAARPARPRADRPASGNWPQISTCPHGPARRAPLRKDHRLQPAFRSAGSNPSRPHTARSAKQDGASTARGIGEFVLKGL